MTAIQILCVPWNQDIPEIDEFENPTIFLIDKGDDIHLLQELAQLGHGRWRRLEQSLKKTKMTPVRYSESSSSIYV